MVDSRGATEADCKLKQIRILVDILDGEWNTSRVKIVEICVNIVMIASGSQVKAHDIGSRSPNG